MTRQDMTAAQPAQPLQTPQQGQQQSNSLPELGSPATIEEIPGSKPRLFFGLTAKRKFPQQTGLGLRVKDLLTDSGSFHTTPVLNTDCSTGSLSPTCKTRQEGVLGGEKECPVGRASRQTTSEDHSSATKNRVACSTFI